MQQRRVRLGDVLDDYCPRERRITNHAVVAMVDDEVKQTRCSTCDAEHEYKEARTPAPRRRKAPGALSSDTAEGVVRPRAAVPEPSEPDVDTGGDAVSDAEPPVSPNQDAPLDAAASEDSPGDEELEDPRQDEWVHRPLIRATLPRQEGQTPERKAPDFTLRQPHFDNNRNGQRPRGARPGRPGHGPQRPDHGPGGQGSRFPRQGQGGHGNRRGPGSGQPRHGSGQPPHQGSGQSRQSSGHNRGGSPQGQHGGRPQGQPRGPRQGSGPGRKRGR